MAIETELIVRIASGGAARTIGDVVKLKKALGDLGKDAKDATALAGELGKAFNLNPSDVDDLANALKQAKTETDQLAKSAGGLNSVFQGIFQGVGQQATLLAVESMQALGAAIQDTATQALNASSDYEAAIRAINSLGVNGQELAVSLNKVSDELDNNPIDTLKGSYDIVSSGFSDVADVSAIAAASIKTATGGFSDFATVSSATVAILNAYGLEASEAESITDKLIATQNQGVITVGEYADRIGLLAPTAKLAGVSLDELNGIIAVATLKGVPVEQTFSGLRQALSNVLKPSAEAAKFAQEIGIQFDATAVKTKGLEGILQELEAKGLTSAENLFKLFGSVEAVSAIAPSAGIGLKELSEAIEASKNSAGATNKAFAEIGETIPNLRAALDSELAEGFVALGQAIEPVRTALLKLGTALVDSTLKGDAGLAQVRAAAEALAAALKKNPALVQAIASALAQVGGIISSSVASAFNGLANQIGKLSQSDLKELADRFVETVKTLVGLAGQIGQVALAFGELTVGVGTVAVDAFNNLAPALGAVVEFLGAVLAAVKPLTDNTQLLSVVMQTLFIRMLAIQGLALGQALAAVAVQIAATGFAALASTGGLAAYAAGLAATATAAIAAASPLVVLAAAVAAVNFVKFTRDLKVANDALEAYITGLSVSTEQGFVFANKLNNLNDAIAAKGGKATAEQLKNLKEYTRLSKEQVADLQRQLSEVQAFEPKNDAQRQSQQNLISQLNTTIKALNSQITQAEGTLAGAAGGAGEKTGEAFSEGVNTGVGDKPVKTIQDTLNEMSDATRAALDDLSTDAANARAAILEAGGDPAKLAALETKTLNDRIKANRAFLAELQALQSGGGLSTEDAAAVADQVRGVDAQLASDRIALAQQTLDAKKRAEEAAAKAAEEAAKKQTDALKAQRDAEKELAEGQNTARTKNENKAFAENERDRQKDFAKSERELDKANQEELEALQEESQKRLQAQQKAFDQQQQAAAEAFQNRQNQQRDTGNREFDALGSEVDKRLQLAQAEGDQRKELIKQFAEERKTLELRRQIEKEVLAQRGTVLAAEDLSLSPLEQARADFEARLQAEAAAFQAAQSAEKEAFEIGLTEQRKLDEEAIGQVREDQEEARRKRQEQFDDDQRDRQEAFETRQEQREAKFRADQRRLDEESAKRIEQILAAAKPKGQSLRSGGVAEGGMVQVHKDEFLLPPRGTRVVSQRESRELVREALSARQTAALMRGQVLPVGRGLSVPSAGGQGEVVAKLDQVLKAIKERPAIRPQATYHLTTATPQADAVGMQLEEIRGLVRMGRL